VTSNAQRLFACGDDLITITVDNPVDAQKLSEYLRLSGEWHEAVAGIDSVVVQFDAALVDLHSAMQMLEGALAQDFIGDDRDDSNYSDDGLVEIPIVYGGEFGPDLDALCDQLGLTRDEFIALHTHDEHRVDMLGFTPGFAYVDGLNETRDVARLAEPRLHVPAGSIGIADGRTGIYSLQGPGGWRLIGRTPLTLFDAHADDPFLLYAGARVRFKAIDKSDA